MVSSYNGIELDFQFKGLPCREMWQQAADMAAGENPRAHILYYKQEAKSEPGMVLNTPGSQSSPSDILLSTEPYLLNLPEQNQQQGAKHSNAQSM